MRKMVWAAGAAFAVGIVIFGWILTSAGFFHVSTQEKQGPETTFSPVPDKR
ncbi:MAG TPA: hypothetical protein VGC68_01240 [Enterovirga sp.]